MRNAYCQIRDEPPYRAHAFRDGLKRAGFRVSLDWPVVSQIQPGDVLVIWNRYNQWHTMACEFEKRGATVLVAENGYMGRDWRGGHWYALSRNWHNGRGTWSPGDSSRWDSFGVELEPVRQTSLKGHALLLPQRGFGPPECAMPADWAKQHSFIEFAVDALAGQSGDRENVRVRQHPGNAPESVPLAKDLEGCRYAVTHGSGAGIKAMAMGYPVVGTWPEWIGYPAAGHKLDENRRYSMFCRLAWAMWNTTEIETGEPFARLTQ